MSKAKATATAQEQPVPPSPTDIFNQVKDYLSSKGNTPQDIRDIKKFQSQLRSLVEKSIRSKKPTDEAKFLIVESVSVGTSVYKLCRTKSGFYWYKDRGKYVGKDTPEIRKEHGLPPLSVDESSLVQVQKSAPQP